MPNKAYERLFIMRKISIIGTGNVGSCVAYTLLMDGIASEIVMVDINPDRARGEALDISQGTPFCQPCSIYAGDYSDTANSDIVVVTSGMPRKAGQTRLDLAQANVDITKQLIPELVKYSPMALYVIVSNPVDILTYTFCKCAGIPENHIIGSGTLLDTARLRTRVAEHYNIGQSSVHAYVLGEHGDSSFVPWSVANISNIPIEDCKKLVLGDGLVAPDLNYAEVEEYVKKSGGTVIQRKGATFYAVSLSVCHVVKCLLNEIDSTMTVSTMMHGEYGIDDVCLSTLCVVGSDGVRCKVNVPLTDDEIIKLRKSADTLKGVIRSLDI